MNEKKIATILSSIDIELYDIEKTNEDGVNILRIFITKQDGISLDDCQRASSILNPALDLDEPFDDEYTLEVSSPGVERKLKQTKHFKTAIGETIKIKLKDGQKIQALLINADDDFIELEDHTKIALSDISKARTILL